MVQSVLAKKAILVPLLLLALWLLADNESTNEAAATQRAPHHLAVWTALSRHPPCLRIYRALLEFNLMLWGLALSLWLWSSTVGTKMVGHLLFQPADHDSLKDQAVYFTEASLGSYRPVLQQEGEEEEGKERTQNDIDEAKQEIDREEVDIVDSHDDNNQDRDNNHFEFVAPPSAAQITNAALDSLLLILTSLFLFTLSSAEGGRYVDGMAQVHTFRFIALVAAPVFPLLLFLGGCLSVVIPWGRRKSQWLILSYTMGAPFYHVTFRDGFIGDILTSSVRPLQDVAFTVFYIFSGLQGWWQQSYDLDAADLALESSWMLHTMILPMCMVSPLWCRFLQNLRQSFEYKSRWPYLGNALKYFVAAEVAVFGLFMQSRKQSFLWLAAFVVATLYQIWWDIFMDWALLEVVSWKEVDVNLWGVYTSVSIPSGLRLRKTRIYTVSWMYWGILGVNVVLRFCWTLSFLPPHYLNRAGVLSETFEGDLSAILNPTIALAEIVRRILWGWLRVEWEAIKVARKEPRLKGAWRDYDANDNTTIDSRGGLYSSSQDRNLELKIMAMEGTFEDDVTSHSKSTVKDMSSPFSRGFWIPRKMYDMTQVQILGELCIYATIFTCLGLMAAAHRETL